MAHLISRHCAFKIALFKGVPGPVGLSGPPGNNGRQVIGLLNKAHH